LSYEIQNASRQTRKSVFCYETRRKINFLPARPWEHATGNWRSCYARSGVFFSMCATARNTCCSSRMVIIDNAIDWLSPFSNVGAERYLRKIEEKIRMRDTKNPVAAFLGSKLETIVYDKKDSGDYVSSFVPKRDLSCILLKLTSSIQIY